MSTFPDRRENLYRASYPGCELRATEGAPATLHGHFAVFDQWTEIKSSWEGNFLERIAPGAFTKTFQENRDKLRVLFQHGKDPQIGDKPIAGITDLREDDRGAYYEAELFDGLDPLVLDGLRKGAYGASFRFRVEREEFDHQPEKSAVNPGGLPERTVREAHVSEFGPVTFPAYSGATAGVRSITDLVHDVDTMAGAAVILFDEERLANARAFIMRDQPAGEGERKDYSADQRKQLAKEGKALPDGSFPIVNVADLQNAISAFGRASDPAAAKAHIKKRAAALGRTDLIPDSWKAGMASATPDAIIETQDAPPLGDAEPVRVSPRPWTPRNTPATTRWWLPGDHREVPKSWQH